ncbi:MAG: hypothetical protein O7G87_18085 [bacterium]|nr:hypothetical protein [bacterium]
MKFLFQLALCICLIILTAGTIGFVIEDGDFFSGGIMLIVVWSIMFAMLKRALIFGQSDQTDSVKQEWADRITTLEKRLTDIQDVVIAIDDKLTRQEFRSDTTVRSKEEA